MLKESNFIITPPPPLLTRNTSYLVNEKIKQFNAAYQNNNSNRSFNLSNNNRMEVIKYFREIEYKPWEYVDEEGNTGIFFIIFSITQIYLP